MLAKHNPQLHYGVAVFFIGIEKQKPSSLQFLLFLFLGRETTLCRVDNHQKQSSHHK